MSWIKTRFTFVVAIISLGSFDRDELIHKSGSGLMLKYVKDISLCEV
jgi:hypothetical protein